VSAERESSEICSAGIQALSIPFIWLARRKTATTDPLVETSRLP
jgi:hypothetical protein